MSRGRRELFTRSEFERCCEQTLELVQGQPRHFTNRMSVVREDLERLESIDLGSVVQAAAPRSPQRLDRAVAALPRAQRVRRNTDVAGNIADAMEAKRVRRLVVSGGFDRRHGSTPSAARVCSRASRRPQWTARRPRWLAAV